MPFASYHSVHCRLPSTARDFPPTSCDGSDAPTAAIPSRRSSSLTDGNSQHGDLTCSVEKRNCNPHTSCLTITSDLSVDRPSSSCRFGFNWRTLMPEASFCTSMTISPLSTYSNWHSNTLAAISLQCIPFVSPALIGVGACCKTSFCTAHSMSLHRRRISDHGGWGG